MKKQLEEMEKLVKKYPNIQAEYDWDDNQIYFTSNVNKIVDSFDEMGNGGYNFYIQDGDYKIYADPRGAYTETDAGYEYDWLPEIVDDEINPALLVKLMRHINSIYLYNKDYQRKMPYLKEWFEKY